MKKDNLQIINLTSSNREENGEVRLQEDGFYLSSDNLIDSPVILKPATKYRIIIREIER
jgi:hypothetical protein